METEIVVLTSIPVLMNRGCFLTVTLINKSPFLPPSSEELPLSDTFKFMPVSTPRGNDIVSVTYLRWAPVPLQVVQNCLIIVP
jgi:hypothetical protein